MLTGSNIAGATVPLLGRMRPIKFINLLPVTTAVAAAPSEAATVAPPLLLDTRAAAAPSELRSTCGGGFSFGAALMRPAGEAGTTDTGAATLAIDTWKQCLLPNMKKAVEAGAGVHVMLLSLRQLLLLQHSTLLYCIYAQQTHDMWGLQTRFYRMRSAAAWHCCSSPILLHSRIDVYSKAWLSYHFARHHQMLLLRCVALLLRCAAAAHPSAAPASPAAALPASSG
jgi:hypothetical protein